MEHGDNFNNNEALNRPDLSIGGVSMKEGMETPSRGVSADVVERLINGEHDAFDEIFTKYYTRIKIFLIALTKSKEDSEELTQELFVNLWQNREKIDSQKNFNAYLFTLARNSALNMFRSRSVRDSYANQFQGTVEDSVNGEDIIYAKEIELLVRLVVSRMPAKRREIYVLSRIDNLTNDEIAVKLDVTKKAVEKHLRLALTDIREAISSCLSLLVF